MQLKNELCIHAMGSGVSAQMVGRAGRGRRRPALAIGSARSVESTSVVCLHVCLSVSRVSMSRLPYVSVVLRAHAQTHGLTSQVSHSRHAPLPSPHTSRVTPRHHMHVAWPVASRYVRGTWHRTRENPENCQLNGNLRSQRVYLADSRSRVSRDARRAGVS